MFFFTRIIGLHPAVRAFSAEGPSGGGERKEFFEVDGIPEPGQVGEDRPRLPRQALGDDAVFPETPADPMGVPAMDATGPKPLPRSPVEPAGEEGLPDPFAAAELTPLHPYAIPEVSPDEIHRVEKPRRLFRLDYLLAALFGLVGFVLVILTYSGIGMAWDEAYYHRPAVRTAEWLYGVFDPSRTVVTPEAIDFHFGAPEDIPELPMAPKLLFAFGLWLGEKLDISRPYIAMRLPVAMCYGLTIWVLYLLAGKFYARAGAILTVLCYMIIPRVFGHAHIAGTETFLIFFCVLLTYCFVQGLSHWGWSIATGVVFGLAMATKINALFFPLTLIVWAHVFQRRHYANNLFAMIFLSPLVMFAIWPWLWPSPFERFLEFVRFFVQHKNISVFYFGTSYPHATPDGVVNAPWHYPFVLTAFTTPTLVLVLGLLGLARTVVNLRKHDIGALCLLQALAPLCVSALPFSPKYDGVRLFIPAFPFVALLAGIGAEGIVASIRGIRVKHKRRHAANFTAAILAASIAGYGLIVLSANHPHYLSYWNLLFGGRKGAHRAGMETTYWGEAANDAVYQYLNDLPEGTHVRLLGLHDLMFKLLQLWGVLKPGLEFGTAPPGDVVILQVREGFFWLEELYLYELRNQIGQTLVGDREIPFVVAFDLRKHPDVTRHMAQRFWPSMESEEIERWIQRQEQASASAPGTDAPNSPEMIEIAP